jgi:hypothetical protein
MAPRSAPDSFDLHAVRVGSFVVQAGALLDVPLARDPCLRVDVGRRKACVEVSLPATRGHRRVSHRLARLEYGDETVEWFRLAEGGTLRDFAETRANDGFVVLRLASPPALTAGRVETPRDAKKSDEETRGSGESVSANVAAARRERKASRPFVTWGTAGKASDFTAGEASRAATVILRFFDSEAAARAAAALERAWPGKKRLESETDAETDAETPSRRNATADLKGFGDSLASWLGKRARPDGRVHQPPRKRYAADGPADPGFVS